MFVFTLPDFLPERPDSMDPLLEYSEDDFGLIITPGKSTLCRIVTHTLDFV
jgi:hypothetical protein